VLSGPEIKWLIEAFTRGEVPDYQMGAWAMAVFFGGMSTAQTQHPTDAMMHSARVLIVRRTNIFRPPDHEHIPVNPSRT
jgi:thymidine phosphorylase